MRDATGMRRLKRYASFGLFGLITVVAALLYSFHITSNRPGFWATASGGSIATIFLVVLAVRAPGQALGFLAKVGKYFERLTAEEPKIQKASLTKVSGAAAAPQIQGDHNNVTIHQSPSRISRRESRQFIVNLPPPPEEPEKIDDEEDDEPVPDDEETFVLEAGEEETFEYELESGQTMLASMDSDQPVDFLLVSEPDYRRSRRSGSYRYEKGAEQRLHCRFTYRASSSGTWVVVTANDGDEGADVHVAFSIT